MRVVNQKKVIYPGKVDGQEEFGGTSAILSIERSFN
jgi:hypothetical protein